MFSDSTEESARSAIEQSLAGALRQARIPRYMVQAVCLSLAGVDRPSDARRVLSWLRYVRTVLSICDCATDCALSRTCTDCLQVTMRRDIFPLSVHVSVHNDSVAALASGTRGQIHGCVLISGTGTIAVGFTSDGRQARAAGSGTLLGDKGR